jgi:DNA-binding beta-propeller fold protein YncE
VGAGNGVNSSTGQAAACNPAGTQIYVVGSISEGQDNIVLLQFDQFGTVVPPPASWDGRWLDIGGNNTYGKGIAISNTGLVYIVGEYIAGIGNSEALVMQINPDRTLAWAKAWGSPAGDEGRSIALDQADGSVYITGFYNNNQVMVVKFSANGLVDWQKAWIPEGGTGQGNGITLSGGSVFVTGDVGIGGEFSLFLLELDKSDGSLISQRIWGDNAEVESGWAVAASPDGGSLLVAGVALDDSGAWEVPIAQLVNAETPTPTNVNMVYDPGFNLFNEALLGIGMVNGTEDTGGGAPDSLVMRLQH